MRFHLPVLALAVLLGTPGAARAQLEDGGVDMAGGFTNPALQTLRLLQLYSAQMQQVSAMPQADRDEMARRAAEYFTNGAEATGVPTSGPGAAYFQNGAEATAASTDNAVPFGASAFPSPAEEAEETDASAGSTPLPPPSASAQAAPSTPPLQPPAQDGAVEDARRGPSVAPPPAASSTGAPSPELSSAAAAAAPAPTTALADVAAPRSDSIAATQGGTGWLTPLLAGLGMGAFAVLLAVRLRSRRGAGATIE